MVFLAFLALGIAAAVDPKLLPLRNATPLVAGAASIGIGISYLLLSKLASFREDKRLVSERSIRQKRLVDLIGSYERQYGTNRIPHAGGFVHDMHHVEKAHQVSDLAGKAIGIEAAGWWGAGAVGTYVLLKHAVKAASRFVSTTAEQRTLEGWIKESREELATTQDQIKTRRGLRILGFLVVSAGSLALFL